MLTAAKTSFLFCISTSVFTYTTIFSYYTLTDMVLQSPSRKLRRGERKVTAEVWRNSRSAPPSLFWYSATVIRVLPTVTTAQQHTQVQTTGLMETKQSNQFLNTIWTKVCFSCLGSIHIHIFFLFSRKCCKMVCSLTANRKRAASEEHLELHESLAAAVSVSAAGPLTVWRV